MEMKQQFWYSFLVVPLRLARVGTRRITKAMEVKVLMITVVAEYWLIERTLPKNLSLHEARKCTGARHDVTTHTAGQKCWRLSIHSK